MTVRYGVRLWGAALLIAGVLAGCGGGDGRLFPAEDKADGVFIDAPVQGLGYRTRGWSPRTDQSYWRELRMSSDGSKLAAIQLKIDDVTDGGVYTSADGGRTWQRRLAGSGNEYLNGLLFQLGPKLAMSADGQTLYLTTFNADGDDSTAGDRVVRYSRDGGVTWASSTVSGSDGCAPLSLETSASGQRVYFSGLRFTGASGAGCLFRSDDSGVSWSATNLPSSVLPRLKVSADGTRVVAFGSSSPEVSSDGGATWSDLGVGKSANDVALSADGSVVIVATVTSSLGSNIELFDASGSRVLLNGESIGSFTELRMVSVSADMRTLVTGNYDGKLYVSTDGGVSWSASEPNGRWFSAAVSANGQQLAATGGAPKIWCFLCTPEERNGYTNIFVQAAPTSALRYTDASGGYQCNEGELITFYLGNLALGTTQCGKAIHVYQLAGLGETPERGLRIAQLLQSLNTSGDPTRIVLPNLSALTVGVDLGGTDGEFATAASTVLAGISTATGTTFSLVDKVTAQTHVETEIAKLPATTRENICQVNTCGSNLLTQLAAGLDQLVGGSATGLPEGAVVPLSLSYTDSSGSRTSAITLSDNGDWKFLLPVTVGGSYTVTLGETSEAISCTLSNASGTMPVGNVTNVVVSCSVNDPLPVTLSGTLESLQPSQTVTLANGEDSLLLDANGEFSFPTQIAPGGAFNVTVESTNPGTLLCTLSGSVGSVPVSYETGTFSPLEVSCDGLASYTIGGTVSGLPSGESLVIRNDDSGGSSSFEIISANGSYTFEDSFTGNYSMAFSSLPPGLQCSFSSDAGPGEVPSVTVDISCAGARVSGVVNGVPEGGTVQLLINNSLTGGQQVDLTGTGAGLTFNSVYIPDGTSYEVTVIGSSAGVSCGAVSNGTGTIGTTNVTNLSVECTFDGGGGEPAAGSLGGTVTGLEDGDSLMIEDLDNFEFINFVFNEFGDGGSFTMPTALEPGQSYDITAQYTGFFGLNCSVINGTGVMPAVEDTPNYVNDIQITCE